jgi:hypothetical protein
VLVFPWVLFLTHLTYGLGLLSGRAVALLTHRQVWDVEYLDG